MAPEYFEHGKLYQGDALAILTTLPDESVDAVLTDPPYSSGGLYVTARRADPAKKYQNSGTIKSYPAMLGDAKDQRSFGFWASLWLSACWRIAKPGTRCMIFSDWRQLPTMTDAVQAAGWEWRGIVVWHKPSARPMLGEYRRDAEFVIHGLKKPFSRTSKICLPGVFTHPVNNAAKVHLTSKPVELVKSLLTITPEGGTVLDPFFGGGTTGIACMETGRHFIGVELSREYVELAAKRIHECKG